jgi:hypothetical protein
MKGLAWTRREKGERENVCEKRFEIKRTFEGAKNSVGSKYYFFA